MARSKSKERDAKTNRRKPSSKNKSGALSGKDIKKSSAVSDGQTPVELTDQLTKSKNRAHMYEAIKGTSVSIVPEFLKYLPENVWLPVPMKDARRCKFGTDEEYFPAQYVNMEASEYIIAQAPTQKNYGLIWRTVRKVCLVLKNSLSDPIC